MHLLGLLDVGAHLVVVHLTFAQLSIIPLKLIRHHFVHI